MESDNGEPTRMVRPRCQTSGCREAAAAVSIGIDIPIFGQLEMDLCPLHRDELELAVEDVMDRVFVAGAEE